MARLPKIEVRRSKVQGRGVFAAEPIEKGTRIIEYTGERIGHVEASRRYDDETMQRHHTFLFTVSSRTVLDAAVGGNEARFINHSCDPNCEAIIERSRVYIYARRDIPAGAELFYDYWYHVDESYSLADLKRFYPCYCGSPKCRGTIAKVTRKARRTQRGTTSPDQQRA
jgi:SET domain-containing protein